MAEDPAVEELVALLRGPARPVFDRLSELVAERGDEGAMRVLIEARERLRDEER